MWIVATINIQWLQHNIHNQINTNFDLGTYTVKLGNSDQVLNFSHEKKIVPDWISHFFLHRKPYQNFDKRLMTDLSGIFSPYYYFLRKK